MANRVGPQRSKGIGKPVAWMAVLTVVAFALGGYWLVRGTEHNRVVDRGAGVVSSPFVSCSGVGPTTHHCDQGVHLLITANSQHVTMENVTSLYDTVKSRPDQELSVDHVYIDTTNGEVNRLTYGATSYRVETTSRAFLADGIVALAVGVVILGVGTLVFVRPRLKRRANLADIRTSRQGP